MPALIECIPNFSEARRPAVVDQIVAAIQSVGDVKLLDRSSDLDHNRTVITFAGSPAGVEEAAFRAIQKAAELIDLDQHQGEHPRIGATDVVPFVPLSGATMEDCVALARRLGERVGRELKIPVYLYEAAATRPERANLENIRRGQYEALKTELGSKPEREPDFGPAKLPKAGATVIGARNPLIAFNVYLATDDVEIAKKIAKSIRHSSGGFKFVKALGLLVEGRAQVSINFTNYRETPVARVVAAIRREAERYGVGIHHSELVGLIPQDALVDAAVWHMQLDAFSPEQVLETRLYAGSDEKKPSAKIGAHHFLDELAAATPAPGGGAAAAHAAAMGAALVAMVAGLTLGKKKYAEVENEMHDILKNAETLRSELTKAVHEDSVAFEEVLVAFRMPKDTPEQTAARDHAIESATIHAARVPLRVAKQAARVMYFGLRCASIGNLNAISDAASAVAMARAGFTAAGYNVRINVNDLQNRTAGEGLVAELSKVEAKVNEIEQELRRVMQERGGVSHA